MHSRFRGAVLALASATACTLASAAPASAITLFRGDITVGTQPTSLAVGNFNGGSPDLAVANEGSDNVSILLGDGFGQFSRRTPSRSAMPPARSWSANSTATPSPTSRSPASATTTSRSAWARAPAPSPDGHGLDRARKRSPGDRGGRLDQRRQARPGFCEQRHQHRHDPYRRRDGRFRSRSHADGRFGDVHHPGGQSRRDRGHPTGGHGSPRPRPTSTCWSSARPATSSSPCSGTVPANTRAAARTTPRAFR